MPAGVHISKLNSLSMISRSPDFFKDEKWNYILIYFGGHFDGTIAITQISLLLLLFIKGNSVLGLSITEAFRYLVLIWENSIYVHFIEEKTSP